MPAPHTSHGCSTRRVIIDADPGVDDALALLLAFGAPQLHVEGLTIVRGNGDRVRLLGANARLLARLAGQPDVPIRLGEAPPEEAEAAQAALVHVHGEDGLGGAAERWGRTEADFEGFHQQSAAEFIAGACAAAPGEITLVCIGPLSNVAAALELRPDLPKLVREVVVMGGAVNGELRGNRTPAAEANFADDPEAAQAVLTAGFGELVLADLGATHQTDVHELGEACLRELPEASRVARLIRDMSQAYISCYLDTFGQPVAPAHDVVPVMYLVRGDLFTVRPVRMEVELEGKLTRGMSVADWKGRWGKPKNCNVLTAVKNEAFVGEFVAAMRKLP